MHRLSLCISYAGLMVGCKNNSSGEGEPGDQAIYYKSNMITISFFNFLLLVFLKCYLGLLQVTSVGLCQASLPDVDTMFNH